MSVPDHLVVAHGVPVAADDPIRHEVGPGAVTSIAEAKEDLDLLCLALPQALLDPPGITLITDIGRLLLDRLKIA